MSGRRGVGPGGAERGAAEKPRVRSGSGATGAGRYRHRGDAGSGTRGAAAPRGHGRSAGAPRGYRGDTGARRGDRPGGSSAPLRISPRILRSGGGGLRGSAGAAAAPALRQREAGAAPVAGIALQVLPGCPFPSAALSPHPRAQALSVPRVAGEQPRDSWGCGED